MSSFRRFVYLVTDDASRRNFLLRRIDMSRFFFARAKRDALLMHPPPPLTEAELPPAAIRFMPPFSNSCKGSLGFMLLPGSSVVYNDDKVIATDQTGRTLLYHPETDSIRTLCNLTEPKYVPVSLAIGNNLYILDRVFSHKYSRKHCFDGLIYDSDCSIRSHHDWYCHSLPPPPYAHSYDPEVDGDAAHFNSYALVGGGSDIWVSKNSLGTHSYNVASGIWTKAGDWALPLYGHIQYVKELELWFGLTSGYGEESSICALDLTVTPPKAIDVSWRDQFITPPEWVSMSSHLVHLGSSRFCHARFFETRCPGGGGGGGWEKFVVVAGIEVERRAEVGGKLFVLKHRSERYSIQNRYRQWVL